jgi:hypothetical protein
MVGGSWETSSELGIEYANGSGTAVPAEHIGKLHCPNNSI